MAETAWQIPEGYEEVKSGEAIKPGNIDLFKQPKVKNKDGTVSTVDSFSVNFDGREYLLPTVMPDGRHLDQDAAIAEFKKTGRHLGVFADPASADKYARQLHQDYANGKYDAKEWTGIPPGYEEVTGDEYIAISQGLQATPDVKQAMAVRRATARANQPQTAEWWDAKRTEAVLADADPLAKAPALISEPYRAVASAGASIGSTVVRPFSKDAADYLAKTRQEMGQVSEAARKDDWSPWLSRMYGGAAESLAQSGIAAATGAGAAGIIGSFAATEANQALYDAEQAGLKGADRIKYAVVQGAIEGTIAAAFQRFAPGLENFVPQIAKGAMKLSGAQFLKMTAQELPEELLTELGHAVTEASYGIDPGATSAEQLVPRMVDTVAQTLGTLGLAQGAARLAQNKQRLDQLETLKTTDSRDLKREAAKVGIEGSRKQIRQQVNSETKQLQKEIKRAQAVPPQETEVRQEPVEQAPAEEAPREQVQPPVTPPAAPSPQPSPTAPVEEAPVNQDRVEEIINSRWNGRTGNKSQDNIREEMARKQAAEEAAAEQKYPPGTQLIMGSYPPLEVRVVDGRPQLIDLATGRQLGKVAGEQLRLYDNGGIQVISTPEPHGGDIVTPPAAAPEVTATPQPAPPESTGLGELGNAGGAIVDNFYDAIENALKTKGRVPSAEAKSSIGRAWDRAKGTMTPEQFVEQLRREGPDSIAPQSPTQPPEAVPEKDFDEQVRDAEQRFYDLNLPTAKQKQTIREDIAASGARLGKTPEQVVADLVANGSLEEDAIGAVRYGFRTVTGTEPDLASKPPTAPQDASEPIPTPESTQPVPTLPEAAGNPEQGKKKSVRKAQPKKRSVRKDQPPAVPWREAVDAESDVWMKGSFLEKLATVPSMTDSELSEILDRATQLEGEIGGKADRVAYAVSYHRNASEATKKRALDSYEAWQKARDDELDEEQAEEPLPKPASPEQTSGETDIYRFRGRKSLRTNETSPGETDTVSESRPPQGSVEDSEAAVTASETPAEKPAEAPMTQWETEEAERLRGARQDARVKGVSNRYWKEQRKRAEKIKGTRGKVSVSIVEEVADEKDAKKKAKKDRREDRPATILTDKWAITEWEDSGKKSFSLTHTPSGLRVAEYDKITDARALYGFMREVGVDLDAIPDTGKLPDGVVRDGKAAIAAYDHSDLGRLTPEQRERAVGMVETTKTDVAADMILDAYDLGVFGGTRMRDESPRLKKLAKEVPEFAYNPVFTVDADKKLVFQDGHKFRFDPGAFNLHPSELKVGQTVGINLDDLGVKRPKPEDVVKNVLSREFEVKKQGKTGTLTLTPLGGDGTSFTVSGSGEDWSVASRGNSVAGKRAQQLLDGIPWTRKEQIAKNEEAVDEGEGEGIASLASPNPTRQTRSYRRKVEGDKAGIAAADIQKTAQRLFGVAIRHGGFSHRAAGIYKWLSGRSGPPSPEVVRTAEGHYASVGVVAHEIAHHIDEKLKVVRSMPKDVRQEIKTLDYEPQKARAFEGWAEFLRRYMTEPADPAIEAPKTLAWFEGTFLPANAETAEAIAEFRKYAQQFAQQTVFQRLGSLIADRQPRDLSFKEEWLSKQRRFANRIKKAFVDKFHTLDWIQQEARKRGHQGIGIYDLTMAHFLSASSHATVAFEEGVRSLRDGRLLGRTTLWGLRDHLQSDGEYEDAVLYAAARHTLFMAEKKPGYNTVMDVADAEAWIAEVEASGRTDRFEAFAQGLAQFNNDLLKMLVDAGALPQQQAENMLRYYGGRNYFPLHRVREDGRGLFAGSGAGFVNLGKAVQGRSQKGSGRQIIDPIDATVAQAMRFYGRAIQARQQHVLAETLDPKLGGVGGMGGLMDRVDPRRKVTLGTIEEILGVLVEEGVVEADDAKAMRIAARILNPQFGVPSGKDIEWFAERHGIAEQEGVFDEEAIHDAAMQEPDALAVISLWRSDYTPNAAKRTVVIYDAQGKPLMYEMDPDLYATATGMDEIQFGPFITLFREAARWFKTGAVGISTGFGAANLLRDYWEFQGKAEHTKGLASLGKPPVMLGRYIAEKARKLAGETANDALIRLYEESGGKVYSVIGHDVESRRRYRRRRIGKSVMSKLGISLERPLDTAENALQGVQDIIAMTDAPPRLAEAEAALREEGFEARDGSWFDLRKGEAVDHLPEHVRIKAAVAMAEATINFKRIGSHGQYIESFTPFFNATVQASYRQYRQLKSLRSLGKKDAEGLRAARYAIYLSALAATSAAFWLLRHDDDDWREQEAWIRDGYWTWGKDGKTYVRIPKPRDMGIVANLVENLLDAWYHDDARDTTDVVLRDFGGRLPTGGGLVRGFIEAFVADYDYFRGRPLTPENVKRLPKQLQVTPYTSSTSDAIGRVLGKYGIGPIQVEHMLSTASGGLYHRLTDMFDAASNGRLGPEHIPVVRGLVINRHQARSVSTFYDEHRALEEAASLEKAETGKVSDETTRKQGVFESHAELITALREMEGKIGKRRDYEHQPYIVGLARAALGYPDLPNNPNPLTDKDAPEEIKKLVQGYSQRTVVAATEPLKEKSAYKDEESYEKERRARIRAAAKLKAIGMSYEEAARLLQAEYTEDGKLTKGETATLSARLQKLQQLYGK